MKKFFSAFLLMAAMAFSVSTFVACNDVVGEIEDVKAQTTQNAANIEQLQADLKAAKDEAAAAAAAALQAAKDAQKAGDDAMAYAMAAEASAQKALEEAIAEASAALQAHIDDFNTKYALINETLGQKADKTELTKAIADLKAELQTEISSVRTSVAELDKKIDDEVSKLNTKIDDNKKAFDKEIADLKAADVAINTELTKLNTYIETVETDLKKEIADSTKALREAVAKAVEEMNKIKAELVAEDARLAGLINTNAAEIKKNADAIAQNATSIADLRTDVNGLLEDVNDVKELLAAYAEDLKNLKNEISNLKTQFDALTGRVDALFARVQSIVYVPTHSDHKATIEWATVSAVTDVDGGFTVPTIVVRASEMKYLIKAENAKAVATYIAEHPEDLDFVFKGVQTRADEADLEIVNVEADGEYIKVSVVAKNFDKSFFENEEEGCYSAALSFNDNKTNTLTTEFTNLVPAKPEQLQMALFLPGEDDAMTMLDANEVINYLMVCNDYKTVKTAVQPVLGFVNPAAATDPATVYSLEYLVDELGYDITVDREIILVDTEKKNNHNGFYDVKPAPIGIDPYFNIEASGAPEYSFDYSVKEGVLFDHVGKKSTITYSYTCGDAVCTLIYEFELANAQLVVNVGKYYDDTDEYYTEVPWTVALRDQLSREGVLNMPHVPYVGYDDLKTLIAIDNPALKDWKKSLYVKDAQGKWVANNDLTSKFKITEWSTAEYPMTVSLAIEEGGYVWNNEYKVVYTATNPSEHIDVTTNIVIKLTHKPTKPFVVDIPVTFNMAKNGAFQASVDVLAEMYKKVAGVEEGSYDYLGFGDKNAEAWAAYVATVPATYMDGKMGSPVVNDNKRQAGYVYNIMNLTTAQIAQNQYVAGQENVITWDANGIVDDFDFDVNIHGNVNIPAYELLYSKDLAGERVHVNGRIDNVSGKYVITQADLAKYFNVNRLQASGIDENHALTVEFAVTDTDIAEQVKVANADGKLNYVTVVEDNKATFLSLKSNEVVLDWNNYLGLEVPVTATLKVNEFPLGSLDLVLWTEDPLRLDNTAKVEVNRVPGKDHTVATIYQNLSLTSVVDGYKENLIDSSVVVDTANGETWAKAYDAAATVYDAKMSIQFAMAEQGVYYEVDGEKIYIDENKFKLDPAAGTITLYGDDADLNVTYIAKCYVSLTHKFCDDMHKQAQLVTVMFLPKNR